MNSLYIHFPFCNNICAYCDFTKKLSKYYDIDKYIAYLNQEIEMYNIKEVNTIYIGGGTPSILSSEQIQKIKLPKFNGEFSFEMNPEDVSFDKLEALKQIGVTRISMGVQTINEKILLDNKRIHTIQDVINALNLFRQFEFSVNLDFMYGFMNETKQDIINNLNFISQYNDVIDHISYYNLILEDNTILNIDDYDVDEESDEINYYYIIDELKKLGFMQYEISNFCKENKESQHNLVYWHNQKYYGVGCGSSGYIDNIRYKNVGSIFKYYKLLDENKFPIYEKDEVDDIDYIYEYIMLGLRLRSGIEIKKIIDYEVDLSQLETIGDFVRIKDQDLFISNEMILNVVKNL